MYKDYHSILEVVDNYYNCLLINKNAQKKKWNNINNNNYRASFDIMKPERSSTKMMGLFALFMLSCGVVFVFQYQKLPDALSAEQAGKMGFSEMEAMKHVKALSGFGPHSLASDALRRALKYVSEAAEKIKKEADEIGGAVEVEVDEYNVKEGANYGVVGGQLAGKTFVYEDLNYIVMRISPKNNSSASLLLQANTNQTASILVSSHIDTTLTSPGAGDCSSCIGVMLEVARAISLQANGFKRPLIFLFNVGEEQGLNGAHSFITQHRWSKTVGMVVNLKALGTGGKSTIFQAGPDPWAVNQFSQTAKYPSGDVIYQDLFSLGVINTSTDFQIYKEVGGLSGLDMVYLDNAPVYHTKNDKVEFIKPGSLQHLGENMLPFLIQAASSPHITQANISAFQTLHQDPAIYFDILGIYMIVYGQKFAKTVQNSVLGLSLFVVVASLRMGGNQAAILMGLCCVSSILMWGFSLSFSISVAYLILPVISSSAIPYVTSPWLVIGLFGFPAVVGALFGQSLGFLFLKMYLSHISCKTSATIDSEHWLFKSGFLQWLLVLMFASYYELRSSYIPLAWLVTPALSYGILEKTLSPFWSPKPLKISTLLIALSVPILISSGSIMRVFEIAIETSIRFDRDPGSSPEWKINITVAALVAAVVCLMMVYLLSYAHLSGATIPVALVSLVLFGLSLAAIKTGFIPPYTEATARSLNVVHVVDMGTQGKVNEITSYVSMFSSTPGKLTREAEGINEGFQCGGDKVIDFVTFSMKYGCLIYNDTENGWSQHDIPEMTVSSDREVGSTRVTEVSIDTKISRRWALAINADNIKDFEFRVTGDSNELVSKGNKYSVDGWHVIQFSGGGNASTKFDLILFWDRNNTPFYGQAGKTKEEYLLRLRADVNKLTPKVESILMKLPSWSTILEQSTSPYPLSYFTGLPIDL